MTERNILNRLASDYPDSPQVARLKAALLYEGVQFDPCLVDASEWAFPNFMPYHLPPGIDAIQGQRVVNLPYLFGCPMTLRLITRRIRAHSRFVGWGPDGPSLVCSAMACL